MKRWQLLFLAIIFGGFLVLSACGTDDSKDEEIVEENETDEETEVIEEDEEDKEVVEEEEDLDKDENVESADENESAETTSPDESNKDEEVEAPKPNGNNKNNNNDSGSTNNNDAEPSTEIVKKNDTFRVFEPADNTVVNNEFTVRGEAATADGIVRYEFEDGHNILDEGTVEISTTDWGAFEFTINFDEVAFDVGTIILFEQLDDGSRTNQLYIPVTVE